MTPLKRQVTCPITVEITLLLRLTLGGQAQNSDDHIVALIKSIQLLRFTVDSHRRIPFSEHKNVVAAVQDITGTTTDLFGND